MKVLDTGALGRTLALIGLAAATFVPVGAAPVPFAGTIDTTVVRVDDSKRTYIDTYALPDEWIAGLFGRSGELRARFIQVSDPVEAGLADRLLGDGSRSPGVYAIANDALPHPLSVITMLPFTEKRGGRIGDYVMGNWPAERRGARSPAYQNPDGFIRVTPENQDLWVSEHFKLRDFLTHDQARVWPKYLVLREELVDKLELVIGDLEAHGTPVTNVEIMSGFRHPHYNQQGVAKGGRARDSRHQFGDAADIYVDNNRDGRMDDLNRDGRVNVSDVRVIEAAVQRVESRHPELTGGMGLYKSTSSHGPYAHIDTRGNRARWGV